MITFCRFMSQFRFDLWDAIWWLFMFALAQFHWSLWWALPIGAAYMVLSLGSYIAVGGRAGLRS